MCISINSNIFINISLCSIQYLRQSVTEWIWDADMRIPSGLCNSDKFRPVDGIYHLQQMITHFNKQLIIWQNQTVDDPYYCNNKRDHI